MTVYFGISSILGSQFTKLSQSMENVFLRSELGCYCTLNNSFRVDDERDPCSHETERFL